MYILLARLTLIVHKAFILFAVAGGVVLFYRKNLIWLHGPVVAWAAGVAFLGLPCPLTPLEKWFLNQAHYPAYSGSFIEHYLLTFIYPAGLTRSIQISLGLIVIGINTTIYWLVFLRNHN
ncbi:MAG: DUF2784 domain-containing protein [bacterium]